MRPTAARPLSDLSELEFVYDFLASRGIHTRRAADHQPAAVDGEWPNQVGDTPGRIPAGIDMVDNAAVIERVGAGIGEHAIEESNLFGICRHLTVRDWPFTADKAEEVAKGYKFTEGPTWVAGEKGTGFFVFCDMADDTVFRWDGGAEKPTELRKPSGRSVGSCSDGKGNIYNVETAGRRLIKWSVKDGKPTEATDFASKFEGKKLGGMNDCAYNANGSVYATHGTWFIDASTAEFKHSGVIRVTGSGEVSKVCDGLEGPNGICFSPDGGTAYVTEYGAGRINAYPVKSDGTFGDKTVFADLIELAGKQGIKARKGGGGADGIRSDNKGNIYSTGPGGIWVLSSKGDVLGHLPQRGTNLAFGGADGKTLLITTGGGVMKIGTKNAGAGW